MTIPNVVYILGAGFSAPLGLPVMSNFLSRSKDQFAAEPERFAHFRAVFDAIAQMSVTKNYYQADLFNIEEILSIIEMGEFAGRSVESSDFIQYLSDVIAWHTPTMPQVEGRVPNQDDIFGQNYRWRPHGYFVSALLGIQFIEPRPFAGRFLAGLGSNPHAKYSVVTLNYDHVVENVVDFLGRHHQMGEGVGIEVFPGFSARSNMTRLMLAKLHGTLGGTIVPPTWSKGRHPDIQVAWKEAHRAIANANYVRFIGYSLPFADTNVRYLMKSAVIQAPNLKGIDVICLDDDEKTVEAGYREFIPEFGGFRFMNVKTERYLGMLVDHVGGAAQPGDMSQRLETVHANLFEGRG